MTIKIRKNEMHNLTAKISKQTNEKIDKSLDSLREVTGIELKKNEWIEHLLSYALENAEVEIENNDVKISVKDHLLCQEKQTKEVQQVNEKNTEFGTIYNNVDISKLNVNR